MDAMTKPADKSPAGPTKTEKRPSLTIFLKNEEDRTLKLRLQKQLVDGQLAGLYPPDMTLSEYLLVLLKAQMAASTTGRKK